VHKRTVGSHRHYRHPQVPSILTVNPGKDAKRYQVRELLAIVDEYGLSLPE
jgi:predicted RNA binding protein YcfA (HicA-like mRNA interferase family)